MEVLKGDYIIKGVKGEFYPCKPDIFEMTYEKVEEVECEADKLKAQQELIDEGRELIEILLQEVSSISMIKLGTLYLEKLAKLEAR